MKTYQFLFVLLVLVFCFTTFSACGGGGDDDDQADDDGPPPYGELTIDDIMPRSAFTDVDTWLEIVGTGFQGRVRIFLDVHECPDPEALTANTAKAKVPRDWSVGVYDVRIVRDDGMEAVFDNGFELKEPPEDPPPADEDELTVETITPDRGYNDGITLVSIRGTGFFGSMRFLIGELDELTELNIKSATRVTAVVPSELEPGTYPITAIRDGAIEFTLDYAFEVMERSGDDDDDDDCGSYWCVDVPNDGTPWNAAYTPQFGQGYVIWDEVVDPWNFFGGIEWNTTEAGLTFPIAGPGSDQCVAGDTWIRYEYDPHRICSNVPFAGAEFWVYPWTGQITPVVPSHQVN